MDFSLSPEQQALVDTANRFARERLAPGYKAREKAERIEREVIRDMGELGFLGPELSEEHGGLGVDCLTSGLLLEQISYGDFNVSYVNLLTSLCGQIVAGHARPDIAKEWLGQVIAGHKTIAIALTEPSAGSDAARLKLKAVRDGNDFVLNGEKTSISMATQSDVAVVFARTGSEAERARGISAFLVPMDLPGITRTAFDDIGTRPVGRGSIFFDDVRVSADMMLGNEGQGFIQVMQGFDYSRALIGLQCMGVVRASLDETWRYIQEREAFGKKIGDFQGVTFPLAEAETMYEACRALCLRTLWLKDQGLPHTSEAAMCKWWAPKLACEIIHQCLLTHGHGGYASDYDFGQRYRDVMGLQIGDGTANIMKMIIGREKLAAHEI
ncbi:cyclohexanecarboxyl-CoA dehydrogenase [Aromatoleum aromaticum]|uniref:Cyclohexanecarboxyl-CoA dehydrogenase n=1 Tax=Aromatoleum aromaticum (strain DSM 19018 / LMG 30748 / EbN1) TaxID=76114 RepID=Q5P656_AROAE|nr:cyclohexanecarboxyl-CoA dehydrogenase [Aromatoleum aromaticum]NMG55754.1 cyclohexanecarboxyl-CoA dehydrogenase [Aromatoleum aromaticum]CAI07205.1 Cyclohexanecarboxyl-CoA dehydrogenase [Aromatoleum aromaticum EbN1]